MTKLPIKISTGADAIPARISTGADAVEAVEVDTLEGMPVRIVQDAHAYPIGIAAIFTSATSSTTASYTAIIEGAAGQTLELFLNGVSQGNMTETSAGVYELDVTLNQLINILSVDSASLTVAFNLDFRAFWDFAQAGQTLTDFSGNGHHGTAGSAGTSDTNDPTPDASSPVEYWGFDSNDHVTIPIAAINTAKKLALYCEMPDGGSYRTFISAGDSAGWGLNQDNQASNFALYSSQAKTAFRTRSTPQIGLSANALAMLSVVRESTSQDRLYWNQTEVSGYLNTTGSGNLTDGTNAYIGWDGGTAFCTGGKMYYIAVFDSDVPEADIYAYFKAHAKANKPTLYASLP